MPFLLSVQRDEKDMLGYEVVKQRLRRLRGDGNKLLDKVIEKGYVCDAIIDTTVY
jgi:hypothetical protein